MERQIIYTDDGSTTISIPDWKVTYHSHHGAIQESSHVFIKAGLQQLPGDIHILEIGFGTGLNALLTLAAAEPRNIFYETTEIYPLTTDEVAALNYCQQLQRPDLQPAFEHMHYCAWEEQIAIRPDFIFQKHNSPLQTFSGSQLFHLIYFDAFAPTVQPELWTTEIFARLHSMMHSNGILVTYCSKSSVRRAMQAGGFRVDKIPGPYGKREMVRAVR
jgi:tRNA U34 5-methylaminomethyl-2-thiouridine-forming methyltransferase MnmC